MLWFIYRYILKTKNTWKFKIAVKLKDEALINVINFPETAQEDSHWLLARKTETACVFLCYKEHTNVKIICKYSDNTYLKAQTSHTWGSRLPRKCLKGNRNHFVFSLSLFFFLSDEKLPYPLKIQSHTCTWGPTDIGLSP